MKVKMAKSLEEVYDELMEFLSLWKSRKWSDEVLPI